ncbi:MAG: hypothetical protein J1F41_00575 [Lachnospiraceae bacterium]|nr:hypothetical protein [Lachnospiraceae bacterium]
MEKEIFVSKLSELSGEAKCAPVWVEWAEECVAARQYIDFNEKPDDIAVAEWLDSVYATLYFIRKQYGKEIVSKIVRLSAVKLCLYPFEMVSAAKELQNGGNEQRILRLMEEGYLVSSEKLPTIEDVEEDLKKIKNDS